ncbi:organic hydroperoxide resistance protein [Lysobacter terrestris]|uniref:Organic hydroperoxide resistance protein n=1 Tax=Agrilutibacter terrestris TaxID=2865112 RepID=A0A7H0G152_9GAMM|nr:organic hydroperoxide resistance protein [Lysobacter terrestris]
MAPIEKELFTAHTHITGGRHDGAGRSDDGQLDVKLSMPGSGKPGTNPEQLFGVGYAACFLGALGVAASKRKLRLPDDTAIDADVTLGTIADGNYQIAVKLRVDLPGLDDALKRELVEEGHKTCPYSRATRGNIDVQISIA